MNETELAVLGSINYFLIPAVAIATDNTGMRLGRMKFVLYNVEKKLFMPCLLAIEAASGQALSQSMLLFVVFVGQGALSFVVGRAFVRRARDAGYNDWKAYWCICPIMDILLFWRLAFKRPC